MGYEQYVLVPFECRPVATACTSACDELGEGTTERVYGDPMLGWEGPDLPGCVEQMHRRALGMRKIGERLAPDTAVTHDQRKAGARAAAAANFVWMQYGAR